MSDQPNLFYWNGGKGAYEDPNQWSWIQGGSLQSGTYAPQAGNTVIFNTGGTLIDGAAPGSITIDAPVTFLGSVSFNHLQDTSVLTIDNGGALVSDATETMAIDGTIVVSDGATASGGGVSNAGGFPLVFASVFGGNSSGGYPAAQLTVESSGQFVTPELSLGPNATLQVLTGGQLSVTGNNGVPTSLGLSTAGIAQVDAATVSVVGGVVVSAGKMTVQDGGIVNATSTEVDGALVLTGSGSHWHDTARMTDLGALTVENHATLTDDGGALIGKPGTALIDDATWTVGSGLVIGTGSKLTLQNAGSISAPTANIVGAATVDHASWSVGGSLAAGGTLALANGGVTSAGSVAVTGLTTLTGTGSRLAVTGTLAVGIGHSGTLLAQNGAAITSGNAAVGEILTAGSISANGTGFATLTAGASWTVSGNLILGDHAGQTGNMLLNSGSLDVTGDLMIGQDGTGAMTLQAGAGLTVSGTVTLGGGTGTGVLDGTADYTVGALHVDNGLYIVGPANPLTVKNDITAGDPAGGGGRIDLVQNATVVAGTGDVTIGGKGNGTLMLAAGAIFDAAVNAVTAADQNGSTGTIVVSGDAATLEAGSLTIGNEGATGGTMVTAFLTVNDSGAVVAATSIAIGDGAGSDGDADISNDGALSAASLTVGGSGIGVLTLTQASATFTADAGVGAEAGGNGTFSLDAGTADFAGTLTVGDAGNGLVQVQQASGLAADTITLGAQTGGTGEFDVTGAGAAVKSTGLTVGSKGQGTLQLTQGGSLSTTGDATIADQINAVIQAVSVDTQGLWSVVGDLAVAGSGIAELSVQGAGQVSAGGNVVIGDQAGAAGNVSVSGTLSQGGTLFRSGLGFGKTLTVGNAGTGTLTITSGGLVAPTPGGKGTIDIAALAGGSGTITVGGTGVGSELLGTTLDVGGTGTAAGGSGTLNIATGGTVQVTDLHVWKGSRVLLSGGTLATDPIAVDSGATLDGSGVLSGALANQGVVSADGGVLAIGNDISGTGVLSMRRGGELVLGGNVGAGIAVVFSGAGETLSLAPTATTAGTIFAFDVSDTILLAGVTDAISAGIVNGNTLQVQRASHPAVALTLDPGQSYTGGLFAVSAAGVLTSNLGRTLGWTGGTSGNAFSVAANWDDITDNSSPAQSAPDATDTVEFNRAGGAVTGTGSVATLDVGSAGSGVLALDGGTSLFAGSLDAGIAAGDVGQIGLSGPGALLKVSGAATVADDGTGVLSVLSGATFTAANLTIGSQADSSGALVVSGAGSVVDVSGALNVGTALGTGDLTVGPGGSVHASVVNLQGQVVLEQGTLDPVVLLEQNVAGGTGSIGGDFVIDEGTIQANSTKPNGVQVVTGTIVGGGRLTISGGTTLDGQTDNSPGILLLNNIGTVELTGPVLNAASISFTDNVTPTGTYELLNSEVDVQFLKTNEVLKLDDIAGFAGTITAFHTGDAFVVTGGTLSGLGVSNGNTLTVSDSGANAAPGGTDRFMFASTVNPAAFNIVNGNTIVGVVPCFAAGTRIETDRGPVAVEALAVGDLVVTSEGAAAPIVWIGQREANCRRHPKPETVWPVRVRAGAFGSGLPVRDLYLSPDHAVFLNDVLVPVKLLINGTSIAQVKRHRVQYFHVELPRHSVIKAEGLPVESFLVLGGRDNFRQDDAVIRLFPDFAARLAPPAALRWETCGAAPLVMAGEQLAAARRLVTAAAVQPKLRSA